jgi:hypothetical protein
MIVTLVVLSIMSPAVASETDTPAPEPTPESATPTPEPATPTSAPATPAPIASPTPEPPTSTPEPATSTSDPPTPTPEPVSSTPTPEPATATPDPGTSTPESATPTPTPEATPEPPADGPDAFQIDLVEGEPIEQLDPDAGDTYHRQDRFIVALQITEEERQSGGPGSPMTRTYQSDGCEVTYSWLSFDNTTGESQVSVSDAGGCEGITLSYVGYELPDGTTSYERARADEQELKDSVTRTLGVGDTATFTVDVIAENRPRPRATFEVVDVDAPDVERGDTADVTATVENTGGATGTQNVSLLIEGENVSVGTSAVDIVFVVDDSGSMADDIETVRNELQTFSHRLESEGIDARYAVVTITGQVAVRQEFTSNVSETNRTLDAIPAIGGTEYNYDAIGTALDLDGRSNAKRVVIDLTDEDSDTQPGTPTQRELSDRLNATNTTYIAVTPNATNLAGSFFYPEYQKRPLANMTESGRWYDLLRADFGAKFRTAIAQAVIDVTEERARTVSLDAGESVRVTFRVDTADLPPGTYDVTVSTEDDAESTTLTVTG